MLSILYLKENSMDKNERVWRVLPFGIFDGPTNMAIDEAVLTARAENRVPNTIRFYRWNPSTASIGRNQSLSDEIDLEAAKRLGVGVVRRISGGGAVYHDRDMEITYAVVVAEKDLKELYYAYKDENENE